MNIDFITMPNEQFNTEMEQGLLTELESLTGITEYSKKYSIYAQENKKLIGGIIAYHYGKNVWIDAIYVDKSRRQQGLGKMLIEQITAYAKNCGASELQLNTYFSEAYQFFVGQKFETVAAIQNWKYGCACYLMRKFI